MPLLDIALHAAEERVLSHVGDQLTKHAGALVVGDRVEIQIDRLDIGDVGGDRMGRGQLVLAAGTRLVLVGKRDPTVLEASGLDLGQHRHERREALVQPEVIPPAHGDQVAKPHVGHLVQDGVCPVLPDGLGHLGAEDHRLIEGDAADILHRAGAELGDEELVVLLEGIGVLVGLAVEIETLLRDGENLIRIEVLRQGLPAEEPEVDVAVAVAHAMVGPGHDRGQVGGHLGSRPERPALDVLLARHLLRLPRVVRDHDPVARRQDREREARFEVRLIETGKHAVGVEGLELTVEVDLVVDRILEAAEPGADVLVGACPQHVQLVRIAKVAEHDAGAIEGFLGDLRAVQLAAVDRGGQEIDKRVCPRLLAKEVDGGFAGKGVAVPGQIERNVVQRRLDQLSPATGFIARQVIAGVHG